MFRFLFNVIIILVVCFTLSAIPIDSTIYDLSFTQAEEELPVEAEEVLSLSFLDNPSQTIYNPSELIFEIVSNDEINESNSDKFTDQLIDDFLNENINLIITDTFSNVKYETSLANINADIYTIDFINNQYTISLDGSALPEYLSSDEGFFNVRLEASTKDSSYMIENSSEYNVGFFDSSSSYVGSTSVENPYSFYSTIYYNDPSNRYFIPISKAILYSSTDNWIRTSFNLLYEGPLEGIGLNESPNNIPYVANISIVNDNLTNGYIYSPEQLNFEDDLDRALYAITQTLTYYDNIASMKYYIDDKTDYLQYGVDLTNQQYEYLGPSAYLAYRGGGYLYLSPIEINIDSNLNLEDKAELMFDALKLSSSMSNISLNQTIPESIRLNSATVDASILTLDLSSEFLDAFDGDMDRINTMIDSMLYSFTSIEGISSLDLKIDGEEIIDYYGYNFTLSVAPNSYMNIEPTIE